MSRFGAVQANNVWAWAAVNHDTKTCYFSAWVDKRATDEDGRKYYTVQEHWWGSNGVYATKPGRTDQDEKFALVFDEGYAARIYFVVAENVDTQPRSIKETRTSFVFEAELVRTPEEIKAYPGARIDTPRKGES